MLLFDVLGNEIWLLVVVVLNEEAHVCDGNSWCSSNSRGAMDVNCVVLNVDQVVKFNDSLQNVIIELMFGLVVSNCMMHNGVDSFASVELFDGCAVNASVGNLCSCLEVQNGSSSLTRNLVNVDLVKRIWTKNDFRVVLPYIFDRNLRDEESTQEVSIALIDEAIDDVGFINHGLEIGALVTI
jgi:hypothetical protein